MKISDITIEQLQQNWKKYLQNVESNFYMMPQGSGLYSENFYNIDSLDDFVFEILPVNCNVLENEIYFTLSIYFKGELLFTKRYKDEDDLNDFYDCVDEAVEIMTDFFMLNTTIHSSFAKFKNASFDRELVNFTIEVKNNLLGTTAGFARQIERKNIVKEFQDFYQRLRDIYKRMLDKAIIDNLSKDWEEEIKNLSNEN